MNSGGVDQSLSYWVLGGGVAVVILVFVGMVFWRN